MKIYDGCLWYAPRGNGRWWRWDGRLGGLLTIANCRENLIRTLLALDWIRHKVLINASTENIFIESLSTLFRFGLEADNIRGRQKCLSAIGPLPHAAAASSSSGAHTEKLIGWEKSEAGDGLSARSLKTLFCSRTDKFQTAVRWWWFIAGKFHLKLIVTWSSGEEPGRHAMETSGGEKKRAKSCFEILILKPWVSRLPSVRERESTGGGGGDGAEVEWKQIPLAQLCGFWGNSVVDAECESEESWF